MPDELKIKGKTTEYVIAPVIPVVYAYFLRFLCHYHLDNTILCYDSLRYLKLSVEKMLQIEQH